MDSRQMKEREEQVDDNKYILCQIISAVEWQSKLDLLEVIMKIKVFLKKI